MVIAAISGSLLAAGANLWPTIAEAAQVTAGTAQDNAERHAPNTAPRTGISPPRPAPEDRSPNASPTLDADTPSSAERRTGTGTHHDDSTAMRAPESEERWRTAAKPIAADTGPPSPTPRLDSAWRTGRWEAPVGSVDPATRFDPPPLPWLPGHRGVDFAAATDHPVTAVGPGTVVFAGTLAGRGVVSVDHPGGIRTTYEPVDPLVHEGDTVTAGQTIGHLAAGHASCPTAACLHLGLKRGSAYLDPLLLFGRGQVRLLPRPTGEAP